MHSGKQKWKQATTLFSVYTLTFLNKRKMQNTWRDYFLLALQEITNEKFDYDDFDLVVIWFEKYSEQLEMPRESDIVNLSTQYKYQAVSFRRKHHLNFVCDKLLQHLDCWWTSTQIKEWRVQWVKKQLKKQLTIHYHHWWKWSTL